MKMTLSPKKYVSNFTSSTNNRGVEAKEVEIAVTQLDAMNCSNSTGAHYHVENSGSLMETLQRGIEVESASQITSLPASDEASYIQVIVQKHRKKRGPGAEAPQGSPRLPKSSSPIVRADATAKRKVRDESGDAPREVYVPMMLSYGDRRGYPWPRQQGSFKRLVRAARRSRTRLRQVPAPPPRPLLEMQKESFWKRMTKVTEEVSNPLEDGPERVEVYYFEGGSCEALRTTDGAPAAVAERWARRGERLAARACAELLALPQCLLSLPVTLALLLLRAACVTVRGAVVGGVGVASDYLLKPALAGAFNALVRPPLVLVQHVARALREALQPLWGLLGDALEPAARLAGALRLVHVGAPV